MPMHHVVVRWIAWRWAIGPGQERLSPAGRPSPTPALGTGSTRRCPGTGSGPYGASACVVVNGPAVGLIDDSCAPCRSVRRNADSWEADAMRKLTFAMNL